jgi:hypothetical protein
MRIPRSILPLALASILSTASCREDAPSDPAQAPAAETTLASSETTEIPDEGPLPALRTGVKQPEQLPAITVELLAQVSDGAHYYELALPLQGGGELIRVHVSGSTHAVATIDRSGGTGTVFVRLPSTTEIAAQLQGTAFIATDRPEGRVWQALPFTASGPAKRTDAPELPARWAAAFAAELRSENRPWWMTGPSHPWREFAAGRVQALVSGQGANAGAVDFNPGMRPRRTDLSQLMHTTTAATSMQEALQHDRGLRLPFDGGPATVPIAELQPPALAAHPFQQMLAALQNPSGGTPEPLAKATPSEFWYVRFDDIRVMLRVLDEADTWFTPVAHIMEERAEVRDLSQRYQRQLGLRRSGLAKALGHTVIERVAIMGSDPYLRDGSDVTFVFALRNQGVFDSELARHMDEYRAEVPGIAASSITHGAHSISVLRDPAGTVRQHRAFVAAENLAVVSNSENAIKAVLDAIDGKRRRLSDDEDLTYMLARDPGEHDGFAFLGDHFIAEVVGPRQKVLAARRQEALAELLTPGYAALLYGWLEGKAPADTDAIITAGLLDRSELAHADGATIEFTPGSAARSTVWGSPSSLTPLIDLPAPTLVTEAERTAYDAFARGYQDYWRQFMDPIAIRLDLEDGENDSATATVDIRVLPLIEGTDYGEIEAVVGTERIDVPAIHDGLQMVWAVGADSNLRRDLDRSASALSGKADIGLGWLGGWVMAGTLDRRALLDMLVEVDEDIQLPKAQAAGTDDDLRLAQIGGKLPVYAAAHVRNPVALVATLSAIKAALNEVAPGMVEWGEHARHRDYPIVRVGANPKAPGEFGAYADAIALYYVQADDVLAMALDPKILEAIIDRVVDGGGPKRGVDGGPQFVMEARVAEGRAGWTAVAWALQGQANRTQSAARSAAEILLRGDPSLTTPEQLIARGQDYLGAYPVTASGRADFMLTPAGVSDPVHGSEITPTFPALPVEGSPIAMLMQRLTSVRATIAFDREAAQMNPPARSLHTQLQVRMGTAVD